MTEKATAGEPFNFNELPTRDYLEQRQALIDAFCAVRRHSEQIASRFSPEDQQLQSMPEASPVKWHLAHTSWFFETFILAEFAPCFECFDEHFCYLFNSYYNAVGRQYPRPQRGLMSRPGLERVMQYRKQVTTHMLDLLQDCDDDLFGKIAASLLLGLNHEQQHQELIMTDISHALLHQDSEAGKSASRQSAPAPPSENRSARENWLNFDAGETITGYQGQGFCFDNELAAHPALLLPFQLASQAVNNAQWIEFIDGGGYDDPMLWLADGWAWKCANNIRSPLYWYRANGSWYRRTLAGAQSVPPNDPVSHLSYYEAEAFASWKKARLPREDEWEFAARVSGWESNDGGASTRVNPAAKDHTLLAVENTLLALEHNWEWTQSAYSAYPQFKATTGKASEYNGKFMVNQIVLRGASQATAAYHSRPSYRNFFYPNARWQFTSLRLARDSN